MKIGVLGAGVMGGGIAQVCALAGDDVVCYDIAPAALDDARDARDHRSLRSRRRGRARKGRLAQKPTPRSRASRSRRFVRATRPRPTSSSKPCPSASSSRCACSATSTGSRRRTTILASNTSGLADRRARGVDRSARPRHRLALGVARAGDEARGDRRDARDERGDDRDRHRRGDAVRQAPDRREGQPDAMGLRREPRVLRHGARGATRRRRGHRDPRRGRPADDGLLTAGRAVPSAWSRAPAPAGADARAAL